MRLQEASSYEVREAQLRALAATPAAGLKVLVGSELLTSLNGWLQEGDADGQHTFNRWAYGGDAVVPCASGVCACACLID